MANITNGRCWKELAPDTSPPLIQHGNIVFQAHQVGWIICGFFTLVALVASFWLINKHLQWYTNKQEQRYIVRILFMVPLYAVISFASYLFWNQATPILLVRDCYESTVLTAFFYLLLLYISPNVDEQKDVFRREGLSREYDREARKRGEPERKWVFPFQGVKWKPAASPFVSSELMKWGVLQYCVLRPLTTLIAVVLNYMGLYCDDSYSPKWGHIYITIIVSISVSVAMYCLLQLYITVSKELAPYKPILKLFAVKAVVFLTFWQATGLSLLSMAGLIKDTKYMTANDINNGIAAILETFEMMCFAFLHFKAFTYIPYKPHHEPDAPPPQRTPRLRSLCHAMDFRETAREVWAGCVYMHARLRGKETDVHTRRAAVMEDVFGRPRLRAPADEKDIRVDVEETVDVASERPWLGAGDDYAYGLGYIRREKSEALEDQIERELQSRGYTFKNGQWTPPNLDIFLPHSRGCAADGAPPEQGQGHERGKRSWWRSMYDRVSQSGPDHDDARLSPPPRRSSRSRSRSRHRAKKSEARPLMVTYDDPPPPSAIRTYRSSRNRPALLVPPETDLPGMNRSDSVLGRLFPAGSRSDLSTSATPRAPRSAEADFQAARINTQAYEPSVWTRAQTTLPANAGSRAPPAHRPRRDQIVLPAPLSPTAPSPPADARVPGAGYGGPEYQRSSTGGSRPPRPLRRGGPLRHQTPPSLATIPQEPERPYHLGQGEYSRYPEYPNDYSPPGSGSR
ncbi:DUF300-domain-containing protein [Neolentinus lepideus HHB14362 ss-1]|uniref:DUF300-domain-containing protein n=1 Tax=Neolentinus lepideus HHB14362 ss-1 TaxID=1314782 RepID=A0A165RC96_9AGAM|nr:DUF300-domain-containing protein [Neolentinus lepideus HHB14362 ss-1]